MSVPKVIEPPFDEPITMEEARLQLSLDDDGDSPPTHPLDSLIAVRITAAREYCEDYLGRALAPQTLELALDSFIPTGGSTNGAIELPMPPIISITSVTYVDSAGDEQVMDASGYVLDNYQEPGWVLPAYGTSWPSSYGVANALKIRYLAGYTLPGDDPQLYVLPAKYIAAMMLLMTDMVVNRTGEPSAAAMKAAENLMDLGSVRMRV